MKPLMRALTQGVCVCMFSICVWMDQTWLCMNGTYVRMLKVFCRFFFTKKFFKLKIHKVRPYINHGPPSDIVIVEWWFKL